MRARADLLSDLVCELCRIGEEDRNAHSRRKAGDKLTAREGVSLEGRRGVEIFTADGLTLGYPPEAERGRQPNALRRVPAA